MSVWILQIWLMRKVIKEQGGAMRNFSILTYGVRDYCHRDNKKSLAQDLGFGPASKAGFIIQLMTN